MRKIPKLYVLGLFLPVLLVAQAAVADVAADLKQAEGLYEAGQYEQAEQAYQAVLSEADPEKPEEKELAFTARRKLPVLYLATDRQPEAQTAVQRLLTQHADHERLPHAIHEIVEQAKGMNKTDQARQVYRSIQSSAPGAIWPKMGIVLAEVYLAGDQAAEAGANDLIARNASDRRVAEAVAQIGWAYDKLGQHGKARRLYEYIVDNWPDKPRAIYAHTALVRSCIHLRDREAARDRLEQLVQRYGSHSDLPNVLTQIGRGYREGRMYDQAKQVSQYVLDNYPDSGLCIWAQRDIALSEIALGAAEAAQTEYDRLLGRYGTDGQLPYVLNEIADGYRQAGRHGQAKTVAQRVLEAHPDSNRCLGAQRIIVLSDLALGDFPAAVAGTQLLQTRFVNQSGAIWAISEVAEAYGKLGRHAEARDLYKFNLENYSNRDHNIWSLRGYIRESAALDDTANIEAGIATLFRDYVASRNLPMAAVHVGRELHDANHPRAAELFQYVLDKHPNHDQAVLARVGLELARLRRGQAGQTEAVFQQVLADNPDHPLLAEAVRAMAEGYYHLAFLPGQTGERPTRSAPRALTEDQEAYVRKAIAKWDTIIAQLPEHRSVTPMAHYHAAVAYGQLGDYTKAIQYCNQLVKRWPNHERAWQAQFLTAKILKRQMREDFAPDAERLAVLTAAYENAIERYPEAPAAPGVRQWLEQHGNSSEGGQQ